jgi:hypothetical protein
MTINVAVGGSGSIVVALGGIGIIVADGCGGRITGGGVDVLTAATWVGVRLPVALGAGVDVAVLTGKGVRLGARVGVVVDVAPGCGVLLALAGLGDAVSVVVLSGVTVRVLEEDVGAAVCAFVVSVAT